MNSTARLALYGGLAGGIATAAWAARRGFDLLDGGCYYLEYTDPADVADLNSSFHLVGRACFYALGRNIVWFRIASVLLVLLAAGLFGAGVVRHLRDLVRAEAAEGLSFAVTAPLWLAGGLVAFAVSPAALTYNTLNAAAVFAATGLLLLAFHSLAPARPSHPRRGWLAFAGAVAVAAFDLSIKPPTGLLLGAMIVAWCVVTPVLSPRTKLVMAGALAVGCLLAVLALLPLVGGWAGLEARWQNLRWQLSGTPYSRMLVARAEHDLADLVHLAAADLRWAAMATGAAVVAALAWRPSRPAWVAAGMAGSALALAIAWRIPAWRAAQDYYALGAVARFHLDEMGLLALALLAGRLLGFRPGLCRDRRSAVQVALMLAALALLPFAAAFGTTNLLYLNAAYQAPCWLGAGLVLVLLLRSQARARWPLACLCLPAAGFSLAQYANGALFHPYELKTDLFGQTVPTEVGAPATQLRLDLENSQLIGAVRRILGAHGFKPGDDIFGFFNLPGLIYAVGGRSPVIPWYFGRIYVGDGLEASYMEQAAPDRRSRAFLITQDDLARFRDHFHQGGIPFPEGYDLIGSLTNPNTALPIKIWKPKNRRD